MKRKISDKDVLQLFTSLKNAESGYPQGMIESRRDMFTKQAAAMTVLMNAGGNGANTTGVAQTASTASSSATGAGGISMGTVLETVLVVAIVAEAGFATYVYRGKIAEFFGSLFAPKVEQAANPPGNSSLDFIAGDETTAQTPEGTSTVTAIETPTPPGFIINSESENSINNGETQITSTPAPTDDDNGLHLGQTKQPTKQPKINDGSNQNSNDKNKK